MAFTRPLPGQVIRYSFLWHAEHLRGFEEGNKARPCVVILLIKNEGGADTITVLPITHTPPSPFEAHLAIELPADTKQRLGLDHERSWVLVSEANRFSWPGPDLVPHQTGAASGVVYGMLPKKIFERIRIGFLAAIKEEKARVVRRTT